MFFLFLNKHEFYKRIYESETAFYFLSSDIINLQGFWALSMPKLELAALGIVKTSKG